MNMSQTGHLHTQTGEHVATGEFLKDTDVQGTFRADGPYPDVRVNVLYELKLDGGSTVSVLEAQKDPDDRNHTYHLKLKPQGA